MPGFEIVRSKSTHCSDQTACQDLTIAYNRGRLIQLINAVVGKTRKYFKKDKATLHVILKKNNVKTQNMLQHEICKIILPYNLKDMQGIKL